MTTTYTVHLYREMRLVFRDIEADSPEEAAARAASDGENPEIHDCGGRTFQAVADLILDDELVDETDVLFAEGRLLNAAEDLLRALEQAVAALNTAPRFKVPSLGTDSYKVASLCDRAIANANAKGGAQ